MCTQLHKAREALSVPIRGGENTYVVAADNFPVHRLEAAIVFHY